MRRAETFELDTENGKLKVTVLEVRPKDILNDIKAMKQGSTTSEWDALLSKCCNLTLEQVGDLYPSELEVVITKLKEVNKSFLSPWATVKKLIEKIGLVNWLAEIIEETGIKAEIKRQILIDLAPKSADSLNEDTPEQ